jgi:hypothetical protein
MQKRFDNVWLGAVLGALAPAIAVFLIIRFVYPIEHLQTYYQNMWISIVAPKVISLGVIPNLGLFFLFIYTDRYKSARGVLGITIAYAIVVFILKLSN